MPSDDLTWGYCIHCGNYGRGRFRWMIADRDQAIDQHVDCTSPQADAPPVGRQHQVGGFDGNPVGVGAGALDEPRRPSGNEPEYLGFGGGEVVQAGLGGD